MSRTQGQRPQFDRMIRDLERAKELWAEQKYNDACHLLMVVGSIAIAEHTERGPNDPVPE